MADWLKRGFQRAILMDMPPESGLDIRPFLANVLRGRRVPPSRVEEVAQHYEHFGGVSPLTAITMRQADLLRARPDCELLAPVPLNIVCFRFRGSVSDPATLDALNRAVKLNPGNGESHALLGTLYGMKIDGNLIRGARFGPLGMPRHCQLRPRTRQLVNGPAGAHPRTPRRHPRRRRR